MTQAKNTITAMAAGGTIHDNRGMAERTWIKRRLAELGMPQAELARRLKIEAQRVHEIVKGTREVQPREWQPMADALQLSMAELGTALGVPALAGLAPASLSTEAFNATDKPKPEVVYAGALPRNTVRDLPVYGSAEGGDGVMLLDNDPIEYIERPPELAGVKSAFAVYIRNGSMEPVYQAGDMAYVHPAKLLRPGRNALFVREDPDGTRHAVIKRLVGQTAKVWRVQQFSPAKTYELPKTTWQRAYRIIGSIDAD